MFQDFFFFFFSSLMKQIILYFCSLDEIVGVLPILRNKSIALNIGPNRVSLSSNWRQQ